MACYNFTGVENYNVTILGEGQVYLIWDQLESSIEVDGNTFTVLGTNIYRDDELISFQQIPNNGFIDINPPIGEHTYCVEVVYTNNGSNTGHPVLIIVFQVWNLHIPCQLNCNRFE